MKKFFTSLAKKPFGRKKKDEFKAVRYEDVQADVKPVTSRKPAGQSTENEPGAKTNKTPFEQFVAAQRRNLSEDRNQTETGNESRKSQ